MVLDEPTPLQIPSVWAGEDNFMIWSDATGHFDVVVRSGGIAHRVPAQFVAPGDVAGMKFQELSGIGQEAFFRRAGQRGIYLLQSPQLMTALAVLRRHVASREPLEMNLCRKDNPFPSFYTATLNRMVNGLTYQKIEW